MDKGKLSDLIKEARPNIKESTIKMYVGNLMKLMKMMDQDDLKFLKDIDKVKDKLSEKHFTTQRNYYNSIIIYLMTKKDDKIVEEYNDIRDELNKKYIDDNASGIISDKQKGNFVELSEIKKMISDIENDLQLKKVKKKDTINKKEETLLMVYVILNILIRIPLRNDLSNMILLKKTQYNKLSDKEKEDNNYLVMEKGGLKFVLNDYKTSKKYKEKILNIPKDLEKILRMYLKRMDFKVNDIIFPISRNGLSQLLIKTSKKYLDKSISTTMLRKIVATDLLGDVKKAESELSKKMGTDISTIKSVYVKEEQ
tara:strand:- start:1218 stop:2150 length:933 start_codon:yes stop_codon:yes gene_type:complete